MALSLVLASCAPTTIQTARGPQSIQVLTGWSYIFADKTPLEQMVDQTPGNRAITFPKCQNAAVRAADVRAFGPEAAQSACQQGIERDTRNTWQLMTAMQIIGLPIMLAVVYFVYMTCCLTSNCS